MIAHRRAPRQDGIQKLGFTLIELVISMMVVSLLLVASLHTIGAAKSGLRQVSEREQGMRLAQDLMEEILAQDYAEPTDVALIGLELAEVAGTNRTDYDDVDDYHDWSATPPLQADGTVMDDLDGWERQVTVTLVSLSEPLKSVTTDEGVKRIEVTVLHDGREVACLFALRTSAGSAQVANP